jgi:hypothetical protein
MTYRRNDEQRPGIMTIGLKVNSVAEGPAVKLTLLFACRRHILYDSK